jgi:hypothetical protein
MQGSSQNRGRNDTRRAGGIQLRLGDVIAA